jgi:hypothetical protein
VEAGAKRHSALSTQHFKLKKQLEFPVLGLAFGLLSALGLTAHPAAFILAAFFSEG